MEQDVNTKILNDLLTLNINGFLFSVIKQENPENPIEVFLDHYITVHHTLIFNNHTALDADIPLFLDMQKNTWINYNIYSQESISICEASFFKIITPCKISKEAFLDIIFNSMDPKKLLIPFFITSNS